MDNLMYSPYLRTFFAAMLGGLLIVVIRFSTVQGGPIIDLKAALTKDNVVDILIIGSGPAGLQAAVYGGRAHHNTWVLEGNEPGGLLIKTTIVENWPGEVSIMGPNIIDKLKLQATRHGAQFLADTAISVDFSTYPYIVQTEEGKRIHALSIIIATGATPKKLGIPGEGEDEFWGKGVTNCAICDAPYFAGLDVVVVGGGDAAVEEALQLAPWVASVTIMVRSDAMRASPSMKARLNGYSNIKIRYNVVLKAIEGNHSGVTHISVLDTTTGISSKEQISGVFLAIGHLPNSWIFRGQVPLLKSGHIALSDDRTQRTSIPGVFAAGDVADTLYRQAGVAAGDGIKAAIDADDFLRERGYNESIAQQLEDHRLIAYDDAHAEYVQHLDSIDDYRFHVQDQEGWAIIDFYATYCPSCMRMLPIISSIAQHYAGTIRFFTVDREKSPSLADYLHVSKVPTLLAFHNGALVARHRESMTKTELHTFIKQIME